MKARTIRYVGGPWDGREYELSEDGPRMMTIAPSGPDGPDVDREIAAHLWGGGGAYWLAAINDDGIVAQWEPYEVPCID